MRDTWAVLALVIALTCLPTASAALATTVSFQTPAQASGGLDARGLEWALILFDAPDEAQFHLATPSGGTATNFTQLSVQPRLIDDKPFPFQFDGVNQSAAFSQAGVDLSFAHRAFGTLYVEADELSIRLDAADAALTAVDAGTDPASFLQDHGDFNLARRSLVHATEAGMGLQAEPRGTQGISLEIQGTGVKRVEWHNATTLCGDPASCPDGAGYVRQALFAPTGDGGSVVARFFTQLEAPDAGLTGTAHALALATGGSKPTLAVQGHVRLPLAHLAGPCEGCLDPKGSTLDLDGNLTLANVEHGDGGGLVGEVAGQAVAGRLDETVLDANLLGNPAVQVAVVAAGAVLVGLLGFLFSRTTADAALDNPKRRLIHQLIGANPGIAYRELIRLSDLPAGTARHHLLKLEEMKLVRAIRHGNHVRYFVGDPQGQSLDAIAATRDPELRALLGWIHGAPLVTQKTILEQTLNWGWSRATTQNRLKRLVESGLLIGQREGREIRYAAAGE